MPGRVNKYILLYNNVGDEEKIMTGYIALLRGVNVGGNILKMERLRGVWSELGFKNVRTYVQSGNVVFNAAGSPANLSRAIEKKLAGETRLPVAVIVRTAMEMGKIIAGNPFLKVKGEGIDRLKLHVTFLGAVAPKDADDRLNAVKAGLEQFYCVDREVYLYLPNGYGRAKLTNNVVEKALSVKATTRNWNTVSKLHEMVTE
jgi:uncharacterized protein (DUF1697 family)